jgi:uncharacterized protein (DUF488 family)
MTGAVTMFTIGHGTRPVDELIDVLRENGVQTVIDVRRYPASRRNPQFERDRLARDLAAHGITYEWWGDELGGRRKAAARSRHPAWRDPSFRAYADYMDSEEFRRAFDALLARVAETPTTVMCAETLWWKCHRRLIADAATLAGVSVVHLGAGHPQLHVLNPAVRTEDGRPIYDVGVLPIGNA